MATGDGSDCGRGRDRGYMQWKGECCMDRNGRDENGKWGGKYEGNGHKQDENGKNMRWKEHEGEGKRGWSRGGGLGC